MDRRKQLRLKGYDYSHAGAYFVTVCVWGKWECLAKIINGGNLVLSAWGKIVQDAWHDLINHYECQLDQFIVMPNHVHGIIIIGNVGAGLKPAPTKHGLSEIVRGFKTFSSRRINESSSVCKFKWQRGYYDHIIRNEADLNRVREYIVNNPSQWALDEENPANALEKKVGARWKGHPDIR